MAKKTHRTGNRNRQGSTIRQNRPDWRKVNGVWEKVVK